METPLMKKGGTSEVDYLPVKSFKEAKLVLSTETVNMWKMAGPVALSSLFQYLTISSTSMYAGHLGDIELSSLSVYGGVLASIYVFLLSGMSTALGTLCGQAYGAGQTQPLAIYVQKSWIVLAVTCTILLPLYIYATPVLKFLGQEDDIANLAGKYSILVIPHMFSYVINFPTQRFLHAQSKVNVIMCIAFVALLIHNGLLYIFYVFGWGLTGAAMANNVSTWVTAVAQVIYAVGWCKEEWSGFSWLAFSDIWAFAKLSISSSVMICLEQWYSTFIVILAGQLDNPIIALGSYSICYNIQGWQAMLLLGIDVAISVRVSNKLGMWHPRAAKYSFFVTMFQSLLLGILFMAVIFLSRQDFAVIFTNNNDMQEAVGDLAFLLGLSMVLNSASQVISGVAIGSGWQVMVAYINLACYYIVGLPLGILFGFKADLGVKGLWGGTMCGSTLQLLLLLLMIWKTNWTTEVEQTAKRLQIWISGNLKNNIVVDDVYHHLLFFKVKVERLGPTVVVVAVLPNVSSASFGTPVE